MGLHGTERSERDEAETEEFVRENERDGRRDGMRMTGSAWDGTGWDGMDRTRRADKKGRKTGRHVTERDGLGWD